MPSALLSVRSHLFVPFLLLFFLRTSLISARSPQCRTAAPVDLRTTRQIHSRLSSILPNSTFFSVFSIALDKPCPFWQDAGQCVIRECTVCHCDDSEIPPAWLRDRQQNTAECRDGQACTKQDKLNDVDRSLTGLAALVAHPVWNTADSDAWIIRDEEPDTVYVDLRKNPEQYTGYSGDSARRVWEAVYHENCFTYSAKCRSGICAPDTCKEERALYTVISGLHASISMHIARRYLKDGKWGSNIEIYKQRLRDHPERIDNLNTAFALVVRAVSKAGRLLHPDQYQYVTGNEVNDQFTRAQMKDLLGLPVFDNDCGKEPVFDESDMFLEKNEYSLAEFRNAFRNISMIMDCVGCEKCRLWGKLQFLGLGTALRILFDDEVPELERNEMIALVNVLYKLATSVLSVRQMEDTLHRDARIKGKLGVALGVLVLAVISLTLRTRGVTTMKGAAVGTQDVAKGTNGKFSGKEQESDNTSESPTEKGSMEKSSQEPEGLRRRNIVAAD